MIVVSTSDERNISFLFTIIVMCVHAFVLLDGGVLDLCVLYIVLCAGAVVLIAGLCIFFMILCLATVDCSTLGATGVDTVEMFWVGCIIDLV